MRWILLCAVAVLLALTLAHRSVARRATVAQIELNSPAQPRHSAPVAPQLRLRIAIAPITSPARTFRTHRELAERLAAALSVEPLLIQRDSYAAINTLLRRGEADVAFVCTGGYAAEPDAMDVLAAPIIDGKMEYYALIIVPAGSPAKRFEDLRGKNFLFVEPESNAGTWYPSLRARELGGGEGEFFGNCKYTSGHDLSILAVAGELADGAGVNSLVYDRMTAQDPSLKQTTRVLERSKPFPSPPIVVCKSMPQADRQRLLRALTGLQETPGGAELLRSFGAERFVPARNEDYALLERCVARVERPSR
jgi:phosphonate transport system substrate-binding protein